MKKIILFLCFLGFVAVNVLSISAIAAPIEPGTTEHGDDQLKYCTYQTMRYCDVTITYACTSHKTAEACRLYECCLPY